MALVFGNDLFSKFLSLVMVIRGKMLATIHLLLYFNSLLHCLFLTICSVKFASSCSMKLVKDRFNNANNTMLSHCEYYVFRYILLPFLQLLWRISGKIVRTVLYCTVLCTTVVHNNIHAHTSSF